LQRAKSLIDETDRPHECIHKHIQQCVYINCCEISHPLSPTPSHSSAMMIPENKKESSDDPEPANGGDI